MASQARCVTPLADRTPRRRRLGGLPRASSTSCSRSSSSPCASSPTARSSGVQHRGHDLHPERFLLSYLHVHPAPTRATCPRSPSSSRARTRRRTSSAPCCTCSPSAIPSTSGPLCHQRRLGRRQPRRDRTGADSHALGGHRDPRRRLVGQPGQARSDGRGHRPHFGRDPGSGRLG